MSSEYLTENANEINKLCQTGPNCENCAELNRLNTELRRRDQFLRLELDRARRIQWKMLPDLGKMPLAEKLVFAGKYRPADMVGGDFYDARLIGPSRVAIVFGDVSGHGMGAALVTAIIKSAFQWWQPAELSQKEFLTQLNTMLRDIMPVGDFAAVFLAVYDATDNSFTYINGGHHPEIMLLPGDSQKSVSLLDQASGILLGVVDSPQYKPCRIELEAGDTILMATDGITECVNCDNQMFGQQALKGLAAALAGRSAAEIVSRLDSTVEKYTGCNNCPDDRTIIAMQLIDSSANHDWMI